MSVPVRAAVVAALPREIRGLVGRTRPDARLLPRGVHLYRLPETVIITAGMGASRASVAFAALLESFAPGLIVSVGLAGGCGPATLAGAVYEAGMIVNAQTGERFRCESGEPSRLLVTTAAIAGVREKARLAATYGATMVDMEAATLARLALAHELPFRAIKAISDAHDFELASLSRFAGAQGQFRTKSFALHTALRPHHWRHAAKLGRHSGRALKALHERLFPLLGRS